MSKPERMVPEVRFKGFTEDWEQRKLGETTNITMGQSPESINYTSNPNDYILVQGNADIQNGCVTPRVWTTQVTKIANKGDLIFSVRAPVGEVGRTKYDVVLGRGVAGIKGNDFIFHLLIKLNMYKFWTKYSSGSTFESINSKDLKNANIYLTINKEQDKIGEFFNKLENTIALHQRKLDALKRLKQGCLESMFPEKGEIVPRLRFANFSVNWEQHKLGRIFNILDGDRGKNYPGESDFSASGETLFLDTRNVKKNGFEFLTKKYITKEKDESLKSGKLELYDFVLTSRGTLGNVAYYDEKTHNSHPSIRINSAMLILRPSMRDEVSDDYMESVLRGNIIKTFMVRNHVGSAQPHITKRDFSKVVIGIPSEIEEQNNIGVLFNQLDNLITLHQSKLEKLHSLKKAYLQKMFI